jgi:hypothetical protein
MGWTPSRTRRSTRLLPEEEQPNSLKKMQEKEVAVWLAGARALS